MLGHDTNNHHGTNNISTAFPNSKRNNNIIHTLNLSMLSDNTSLIEDFDLPVS
jgi:hypothetical protein